MRLKVWIVAGLFSTLGLAALVGGTLCLSSGCGSVGYLAQAAAGHLNLLAAARPVSELQREGQLPQALEERLALSQRMRDFAIETLKLPDNHSYRSYADLHRPAAVWNVVAAPELSLQLQTWCFPVVGCVGYRGYYSLADAQSAAEDLRRPGTEVAVYPVPAYSTLGMSNLLGGDPLLSTFVQWPEGELARLMFHELAHQVVYAAGDTVFNESFATSVERLGGEIWLRDHADSQARDQYLIFDGRRHDFRALLERHRQSLDALYRGPLPEDLKRAAKTAEMADLQAEYQSLKSGRWAGYGGYDGFMRQVNNPLLGVQGAYHRWVPAFDRLFEREGRDFGRFYAAVRHLADLPAPLRRVELEQLDVAAGTAAAAASGPAGLP